MAGAKAPPFDLALGVSDVAREKASLLRQLDELRRLGLPVSELCTFDSPVEELRHTVDLWAAMGATRIAHNEKVSRMIDHMSRGIVKIVGGGMAAEDEVAAATGLAILAKRVLTKRLCDMP